jgi:hypothetical protein
MPMQYKTMVLGLLLERPQACRRLKKQRMLLEAVNTFASILKLNHEAIIQDTLQAQPNGNPIQIASQALEIALQHLTEALPSESDRADELGLSLDRVMADLLKDSPTA